jgi:hypothetical protein
MKLKQRNFSYRRVKKKGISGTGAAITNDLNGGFYFGHGSAQNNRTV